ncbi:MAG: cupin domain-containing protein [Campylobacterales bacterium]
MQKSDIFHNIPKDLTTEFFEDIVVSDNVKIEKIVSKGHTSPEIGWYDQDKNEWIIVIEGEAILLFEDKEKVELKSGQYLNIPAHKKHKVLWTKPEVHTIWLAVFY